jgi:hypothetical protein
MQRKWDFVFLSEYHFYLCVLIHTVDISSLLLERILYYAMPKFELANFYRNLIHE